METEIKKEIVISIATENNINELLKILKLAEGEMFDVFYKGRSPIWINNFLAEQIKKESTRYSLNWVYVAKINNKIAGAIFSFPADLQLKLDNKLVNNLKKHNILIDNPPLEAIEGTYYLSSLAVFEEYRGLGIAKILIKTAEKVAQELGFNRSSLLVSNNKDKAKNLYKRYGYESYKHTVTVGDEIYLKMYKNLNV